MTDNGIHHLVSERQLHIVQFDSDSVQHIFPHIFCSFSNFRHRPNKNIYLDLGQPGFIVLWRFLVNLGDDRVDLDVRVG